MATAAGTPAWDSWDALGRAGEWRCVLWDRPGGRRGLVLSTRIDRGIPGPAKPEARRGRFYEFELDETDIWGRNDCPRIAERDPLLARLMQVHGRAGRPDIAPELQRAQRPQRREPEPPIGLLPSGKLNVVRRRAK